MNNISRPFSKEKIEKHKSQDSGREIEIYVITLCRLFDSENPGKQVASKVKTAITSISRFF